ncbi:hypothetical protein ACHAXR_004146 [Thalassiosira sp. AJA248-18]
MTSPLPLSPAGKTATHYNSHSASSYESAFFYSEDKYTTFLCNWVQEKLRISTSLVTTEDSKDDNCLKARRRLLDIGGGTGNFTRMLVKNDSRLDAVVVDPLLSSTAADDDADEATERKIRFVKASAEEFQLSPDVVHHLPLSSWVETFRGLRHGLRPSLSLPDASPSLLIITRPTRDIDYPLWPEAREVWARDQPSVQELEQDLIAAGFQRVCHTIEVYQCETSLTRWLSMIQQRFWSTFSEFSDMELKAASDQIAQDVVVDAAGNITFEDRLVFITAFK